MKTELKLLSRAELRELKNSIEILYRKGAYETLQLLFNEPIGLTATEIANRLSIAQSTVLSFVRKFKQLGFISRTERVGQSKMLYVNKRRIAQVTYFYHYLSTGQPIPDEE